MGLGRLLFPGVFRPILSSGPTRVYGFPDPQSLETSRAEGRSMIDDVNGVKCELDGRERGRKAMA